MQRHILIGIVAAAIAVGARALLDPVLGAKFPFATVLYGVLVAAWWGGIVGGLIATVISSLAADYLWISPRGSLAIDDVNDIAGMALFGIACVAISFLGGLRLRAERHARASVEETTVAMDALRESEQRFREMADAAPVLIWMSGTDKLCNWFNKSWLDFVGRSMEQELGNGWAENVHPEDFDRCIQIYTTAFDGRQPFSMEYRLKRHDAEYRWLLDRGTPRAGPGGQFAGYIGSCIDISDRKRAEQSMEASEERFRNLVDDAPFGIYIVDSRFRIARMNASAKPAFRNVEPLIGRDFGEAMRILWPDPVADEFIAAFRRTMETGGPYFPPGLTAQRHDTGAVESYEWELHRINHADGQYAVACYFFDATRLREAQQALQQSEQRARSVVDHVIDGIITIDDRGAVETFNPAAENIFGYQASEVIGRNVKMLMPEPYRGEHDHYLANYLRTGEARIIGIGREVEGRRKDGSTFPMDLAVSAFSIGSDRHFTGIVRNISERKQAEQALNEAARTKDEFIAMLSHELRNPMAAITTATHVLKLTGSDNPASEQARAIVERQTKHLTRLVEDLLDMTRITRNKLELRKEWVELASVISGAVEMCRPLVQGAKHEIVVALPPEPIYLEADPVRLSQVFSNLLNNACKYTAPGGRIGVTCERERNDVVVKVKDSGIGIPPDMLGRVFDMFAQVDRSSEGSRDGLGVGLSLVRRLVELHDGTVKAFSQGASSGSEFVVRLPVLMQSGQVATPKPTADLRMMTPRRILVVDDNRDAAESLASLLKLTGNETHVAYDGLQVVSAAELFRPDVALLDIGLPKLNGLDVARRIREHTWGEHVLLVALTGWGQDEDRIRSKAAGFDHHVVKPVDLTKLMTLLAQTPPSQHAALRVRLADGGKLDS